MHRKHIKFGFLLGLAVGAYYHYVYKDTRKDQDSLYMLVVRIKSKIAEAKDKDSDLHASIDKAAAKVKDAADDAANKAKDLAAEAGDKVKANVSKAQAKIEDVSDEAASKVNQAADSAAKKADEQKP